MTSHGGWRKNRVEMRTLLLRLIRCSSRVLHLYLWCEIHEPNCKKKKKITISISKNFKILQILEIKVKKNDEKNQENGINRWRIETPEKRWGVGLLKGGGWGLKKRSSLKMEELLCVCFCGERKLKLKRKKLKFLYYLEFLGLKRDLDLGFLIGIIKLLGLIYIWDNSK